MSVALEHDSTTVDKSRYDEFEIGDVEDIEEFEAGPGSCTSTPYLGP